MIVALLEIIDDDIELLSTPVHVPKSGLQFPESQKSLLEPQEL